mgnify:CR=1 FL=1
MPAYLSPGVYVEEIPSGSAPIAGVGTSTAGFIGIVPDTVEMPSDNKTSGDAVSIQVERDTAKLEGKTLAQALSFEATDLTIPAGEISLRKASLLKKQTSISSIFVEEELDVADSSTQTSGKIIGEELEISNQTTLKPGDEINAGMKPDIRKALENVGRKMLKIWEELDLLFSGQVKKVL